MPGFVRRLLHRLPGLGAVLRERDTLRAELAALAGERDAARTELADVARLWMPPGHYYSPIAAAADVEHALAAVAAAPRTLPGIELDEAGQLALLERVARGFPDLPWEPVPRPPLRYHYANHFFGPGDAIALAGMLRELRPRRYVEVGCGWSSAAALDVNDRFLDGAMRCTFIEPYPERLRALLPASDLARVEIVERRLQDVGLAPFLELEANDVLFLDSSHVAKAGSDVNFALFEVLPRLRPGVHVHVHDVFHPFDYPPAWLQEGRNWNEGYLLRAFLTFNDKYAVVLFNDYLARFHGGAIAHVMPVFMQNPGGSIWLRRREP